MTLLAPWALWLSALGLAVIALYLLKIRRRHQPVPALELWRQLASQSELRSLFRRLKRWMSLLLWLVIVTCLVLAVGNPLISLGQMKPESIALVVDNSASMQAREAEQDGKTRLELAAEAIEEILDGRPARDEWMLIDATREPRVLQGFSRDRQSIREAAQALSPNLGAGDLEAAVELADQLLLGKPRPRIVVLTDGDAGRVDALAMKSKQLTPWPLGQTDDNLGITRLEVRRHQQQGAHYAYLRVVNASKEALDSEVVFSIDDGTAKVEPFSVAAGGAWEKTVVFDRPEGGVLRAAIERPDALPADNEAFAVLEPIEPATIFLVTPPDEAFFFEQVLLAMEHMVDAETSQTLSLEEYEKLGPLRDSADLTIFNDSIPKTLPDSGAFVFVDRWPSEINARVVGVLENPRMELVATTHPLTQYLSVGAVQIVRASHVDVPDRTTVLARSQRGAPLVFLYEEPRRQYLCLAFDVLETDLPFRNAFPILLRNAVAYFVSEKTPWVRPAYRVGDSVRSLRPVPTDVSEVGVGLLRARGVSEHVVPVRDGIFTYDETGSIGPIRFRIGSETSYTAINLTDEHETRLAPSISNQGSGTPLVLSRRIGGAMPWLAFAMAACSLVVVEWLTFHFRWTE